MSTAQADVGRPGGFLPHAPPFQHEENISWVSDIMAFHQHLWL